MSFWSWILPILFRVKMPVGGQAVKTGYIAYRLIDRKYIYPILCEPHLKVLRYKLGIFYSIWWLHRRQFYKQYVIATVIARRHFSLAVLCWILFYESRDQGVWNYIVLAFWKKKAVNFDFKAQTLHVNNIATSKKGASSYWRQEADLEGNPNRLKIVWTL